MHREDWNKVKRRIDALPPPPPAPAPSSARALLSKRRKRQGLRCIDVLISEEHIDALCQLEWLASDERASRPAIQAALARFLHASLVEKYVYTPWARSARERRARPGG